MSNRIVVSRYDLQDQIVKKAIIAVMANKTITLSAHINAMPSQQSPLVQNFSQQNEKCKRRITQHPKDGQQPPKYGHQHPKYGQPPSQGWSSSLKRTITLGI